jgi:hypothetical protein
MLMILCVLLSLLLLFLDLLLKSYVLGITPRVVVLFHKWCGMGNQMFQYAAGLGVAYQHPEYSVCVSGLGDHSGLAHANSAFDLHVRVLNISGLKPIAPCRDFGGIVRLLQTVVYGLEAFFGLWSEFAPPHSTYVPFPLPRQHSVLVSGYMQSFKYFQHVPHPFFMLVQSDAARLWLSRRNLTSVVHVRRGDRLLDLSPVVPVSYYEKALRLIGQSRVAVCTDDVEWVKAQRVFENATISIGHDPGFDMALLAAATDSVIIGIGTFGWWGAYLSTAKRKIFYRIGYRGSDLLGYREDDYIPYDQPGQGRWMSLI